MGGLVNESAVDATKKTHTRYVAFVWVTTKKSVVNSSLESTMVPGCLVGH
jgi:hypothetical protein